MKQTLPRGTQSGGISGRNMLASSSRMDFVVQFFVALSSMIVAVTAVFGGYFGFIAIDVYKEANFTATHSRLEARDLGLAEKVYNNPYLAFIYMENKEFPKNVEAISYYLQKRGGDHLTPAVLEDLGIDSVEAMNCHLWAPGLMDAAFNDLIPHYMFAEAHLLLIYDVWLTFVSDESRYLDDARNERIVTSYVGYLSQIGTDYMFLMSVYETARRGYHNPEFYHWLREALFARNPDTGFWVRYFPTISNDEVWENFLMSGVSAKDHCDQ